MSVTNNPGMPSRIVNAPTSSPVQQSQSSLTSATDKLHQVMSPNTSARSRSGAISSSGKPMTTSMWTKTAHNSPAAEKGAQAQTASHMSGALNRSFIGDRLSWDIEKLAGNSFCKKVSVDVPGGSKKDMFIKVQGQGLTNQQINKALDALGKRLTTPDSLNGASLMHIEGQTVEFQVSDRHPTAVKYQGTRNFGADEATNKIKERVNYIKAYNPPTREDYNAQKNALLKAQGDLLKIKDNIPNAAKGELSKYIDGITEEIKKMDEKYHPGYFQSLQK